MYHNHIKCYREVGQYNLLSSQKQAQYIVRVPEGYGFKGAGIIVDLDNDPVIEDRDGYTPLETLQSLLGNMQWCFGTSKDHITRLIPLLEGVEQEERLKRATLRLQKAQDELESASLEVDKALEERMEDEMFPE